MSSNPSFKPGNLAVITGGASGIGLALATKLASYGMKVLIVDINASNLAAAKNSVKGDVETFEMDVSKLEDYEKLKAKVDAEYGGKSNYNPNIAPLNQSLQMLTLVFIFRLQAASPCSLSMQP